MSQLSSSQRSPVLDVQSPNPQVTAEGCKMFKENLLDKLEECMFIRFQELWYQCECVLFHDNESGAKKYENQDVTDVFKSLLTGIEQWPEHYKTKEFDFIKVQVPKLGEWLLKIVLFQAHILATTQTSKTAKEIDVEKPDEKDFVEKMYKNLANEILISLQTPHLYVFSTVQGNSIEAEKRKRMALPVIRRAIENTIETVAKIDKIIEEQMFEQDQQVEPVKPDTPMPVTKQATPIPKTPKSSAVTTQTQPRTPSAKTSAGPQTPKSSAGPRTPKSSAGPQTPKSSAGPRTPKSSAGPQTPKSSVGPQTPKSSAVHQTPKSSAGPRTPISTGKSHSSGKYSDDHKFPRQSNPNTDETPLTTPVSKTQTPDSEFKKPSAPHRKNKHYVATPMTTPSSAGRKRKEPESDEVFISADQTKYLRSPPF